MVDAGPVDINQCPGCQLAPTPTWTFEGIYRDDKCTDPLAQTVTPACAAVPAIGQVSLTYIDDVGGRKVNEGATVTLTEIIAPSMPRFRKTVKGCVRANEAATDVTPNTCTGSRVCRDTTGTLACTGCRTFANGCPDFEETRTYAAVNDPVAKGGALPPPRRASSVTLPRCNALATQAKSLALRRSRRSPVGRGSVQRAREDGLGQFPRAQRTEGLACRAQRAGRLQGLRSASSGSSTGLLWKERSRTSLLGVWRAPMARLDWDRLRRIRPLDDADVAASIPTGASLGAPGREHARTLLRATSQWRRHRSSTRGAPRGRAATQALSRPRARKSRSSAGVSAAFASYATNFARCDDVGKGPHDDAVVRTDHPLGKERRSRRQPTPARRPILPSSPPPRRKAGGRPSWRGLELAVAAVHDALPRELRGAKP